MMSYITEGEFSAGPGGGRGFKGETCGLGGWGPGVWDGQMDERLFVCLYVWTDGRMDGWTDGWTEIPPLF